MLGRIIHRLSACYVLMGFFFGGSLQATAQAQTLAGLQQQQQAKLEDAVSRLNAQRQTIHDAQIPLADNLARVRREAAEYEEQVRAQRRLRDSASLSLEQLDRQVSEGRREMDYIMGNLFGEFAASFKSGLSPGEMSTLGERVRQHDLLQENLEVADEEKLNDSLGLLNEALTRIDGILGGKRYEGEALGSTGELLKGQFVQVGPLLYFADSSGQTVGWVEETKSLQARVRPIDKDQADAVKGVTSSGSGFLPMDPTLGDAVAISETNETWSEHLAKGGIWVFPILGFAIVSISVAGFKFVQVFTIRSPQPLVVHEIVKHINKGDAGSARDLAAAQPQPAAEMLVAGVENAKESVELVEEVMFESILGTQPRLERFLNVIAVTAATAPLLGLLGTVTGIIKTFKLMEVFGAGDPKPLISGISEALITTELGLILAIPALIAHALLSRRVAGILAQLEKLSVAMVNGLSRRGMGDRA